jgi:hypothetical protein
MPLPDGVLALQNDKKALPNAVWEFLDGVWEDLFVVWECLDVVLEDLFGVWVSTNGVCEGQVRVWELPFGVPEWRDGKKELLCAVVESITVRETQTQARAWRSMIRWVCYTIAASSTTLCPRHNAEPDVHGGGGLQIPLGMTCL